MERHPRFPGRASSPASAWPACSRWPATARTSSSRREAGRPAVQLRPARGPPIAARDDLRPRARAVPALLSRPAGPAAAEADLAELELVTVPARVRVSYAYAFR